MEVVEVEQPLTGKKEETAQVMTPKTWRYCPLLVWLIWHLSKRHRPCWPTLHLLLLSALFLQAQFTIYLTFRVPILRLGISLSHTHSPVPLHPFKCLSNFWKGNYYFDFLRNLWLWPNWTLKNGQVKIWSSKPW